MQVKAPGICSSSRRARSARVHVEQLPPTGSLQHHFMADSAFQPYIGEGVNDTLLFSEDRYGPLAGNDLSLDDRWGLACDLGADFMLGETWFLNASFRYIDIETDAAIIGDLPGTVEIDAWAYGARPGFRF